MPAAESSKTSAPSTQGLSRRVRIGYGSGSVATGAFGTVPGLMLLPFLTDSLGGGRGYCAPASGCRSPSR